jgi:excinuclease ABC subunit B
MSGAIEETERRRAKQLAFNKEHGITPKTIIKAIRAGLETELRARKTAREAVRESEPEFEVSELLNQLEEEMLQAAQSLEFEKAATLRDQINTLKKQYGVNAPPSGAATEAQAPAPGSPSPGAPSAASSSRPPKKLRRSDLESTLSTKPQKRPGMPGVRANKKSRKNRG